MKRKLHFGFAILLFVGVLSLLTTKAYAAEGIQIDADSFPNARFREYVRTFDTSGDGMLSKEEIDAVKIIYICYEQIDDLTGIKVFDSLEELYMDYNNVGSLDLGGCDSLKVLRCPDNNMESITLAGCTSLVKMDCSFNKLASLDLSDCGLLKRLDCHNNSLTDLDLSSNTLLAELDCNFNSLDKLDLSKNGELDTLECAQNHLKTLDVSNKMYLRKLGCSYNELTSLNLKNDYVLEELNCSDNKLKSLDLQNKSFLRRLTCVYNPISILRINEILFSVYEEGKRGEVPDVTRYKGQKRRGWISYSLSTDYLYVDPDVLVIRYGILRGWQKNTSEKKYYYDKKSKPVTGWNQIDGRWYFFNTSGIMQTGWKKSGKKWYYLLPDQGYLAIGWKMVTGKWYYFKQDGSMAEKEYCNGYWINANGTCTYDYKAVWHKNSKGWWFGDASGWYAKNQSLTIDGVLYRFDVNGYWKE